MAPHCGWLPRGSSGLRSEFSGLQQLLARIKTDIGIAKSQLDEPAAAHSKCITASNTELLDSRCEPRPPGPVI